MTTIYKNRSNGRLYALEACLMCGTKVCIVDMKTCEDKFVEPSTLKRNYIQWDTAEVVEVRAFTGMKIGLYKVTEDPYFSVMVVTTKTGNRMEFDRKTGLQVNAKNPKYANKIAYTL